MRTKRAKQPTSIEVRGEVVIRRLDSVDKNSWNPNVMSEEMKESLLHGLKKDGWLASQSLLIWGKDDKGKRRNLIIDGEHRWIAATEDGLEKGPMVFLDGLTSAEAKALTIKMNHKHGESDPDLLAGVVQELDLELETDDLALDLGLGEDLIAEILSGDPTGTSSTKPAPGSKNGTMPSGSDNVQQMQLYYDATQKQEFDELLGKLAKRYKTANASDTVLAGLKEAAKRRR